ncbi:MAG: MBL fold metallo-hydrolase [Chitinispirillaceae bacterium]|nr:MBL fold metallo-hydrolase [Chitinispirillaceae bacterium]
MSVTVERLITGPIETNTYIVYNEMKDCLIIDPSPGVDPVVDFIGREQLIPLAIMITHGHFDHIGGIPELVDRFPLLPVYIHPSEKVLLERPELNLSMMMGIDFTYTGKVIDISEGPFSVGSFNGTTIVISGHSPAGCAFLIENMLLCGDILFAGSIGRSDFPGGSQASLVEGIKAKFLSLDDSVVVCPGHGGRSTIGRERRMNPYL